MPSGSSAEPYLEIERTWDVAESVEVPDWTGLPGVASADPVERRELDARYFDTGSADLARAGVALRRRTGGPDEGWHVKASATGGRHEWSAPLTPLLDPGSPDVPDALLAVIAGWASGRLAPLARIRNARAAIVLRDAHGGILAEFVDDHVEATAERTGVVTRWREWELELGPAAPEDYAGFLGAADVLARAAGATSASAESKLARALGA